MRARVRRHELVSFVLLAFAFSWVLVPLTRASLAFGFLALFGPAAAAIAVSTIADGRAGVRDLLRRLLIWRVHPVWYAVALGLPALLSLGVVGLGFLMGTARSIEFSPLSPLTVVLFALVVGEEIGWRGFAQPRLTGHLGSLGGSVCLGAVWATWHLPNQVLPGLEAYGYGFAAFASFVIAMSVLFVWLANHTEGSVLLAWLFHGAINTLIFVNPDVAIVQRWWLSAAVWGLVALSLVALLGTDLGRARSRGAPSR